MGVSPGGGAISGASARRLFDEEEDADSSCDECLFPALVSSLFDLIRFGVGGPPPASDAGRRLPVSALPLGVEPSSPRDPVSLVLFPPVELQVRRIAGERETGSSAGCSTASSSGMDGIVPALVSSPGPGSLGSR